MARVTAMEKPKRGRLIQAPVTEDAYWRIKQAAAKQSLTLGAFVRLAIESAMKQKGSK